MVTRSPNHAKNMRGGWPRGALRLTAMLIAAVVLNVVSIPLSQKFYQRRQS